MMEREDDALLRRGTDDTGLSLGARLNKAFAAARKYCNLPVKEWFENWEFFSIATRRLGSAGVKARLLIDVGGGHGLGAMLWLAHGLCDKAIIIDQKKPRSFDVLLDVFLGVRQFSPPTYLEKRFPPKGLEVLAGRTVVVGLHCCGVLTDDVIDFGLRRSCPVSVVPCCHELRDTGLLERIRRYADRKTMARDDAVDLVRAGRLVQAGWRVWLDTLSKNVTPKNNVITATPKRCKT